MDFHLNTNKVKYHTSPAPWIEQPKVHSLWNSLHYTVVSLLCKSRLTFSNNFLLKHRKAVYLIHQNICNVQLL